MADYLVTDTELTSVADAIRTKGGTSASLAFPTGFVDAIDAISTGGGGAPEESDVNFYDYDGTRLFSYTAQDFSALTEMPATPTHSGLTSQGWNWTLADAKTQVNDTGACDIGATYTTDDGKTRLHIRLRGNRRSPCLGLCPNGTATVDWGDGSSTETMTGTSLTSVKYLTHTYATPGDYVISIAATSGTFAIYGSGSYAHILKATSTSTANANAVYLTSLQRVDLGSSVSIGNYAFYGCWDLQSINIPTTVTAINEGAFWNCYNLRHLTVPSGATTIGNSLIRYGYGVKTVSFPKSLTSAGTNFSYDTAGVTRIVFPRGITGTGGNYFYNNRALKEAYLSDTITSLGAGTFQTCVSLQKVKMSAGLTSIGQYAFSGCSSLMSVTIPSNVTTIDSSAFSGCSSLAEITIPSNVTTINGSAFANCYGLAEIHFKRSTPPTVANSNAFSNLPTDCKIYVPSGKLSAYTSASNYPSSATYTYIEE